MRYLLAFFFFLIYAGDNLGISVSLGPGMSLKNLLLYLILAGIAINAAVARNRKVELVSVNVAFGLIILYAFMTWLTLSFVLQDPEYDMKGGFISLKSSMVDHFLTLLIFFYGVMHLKDASWLLRAIVWIAMLGNLVTVVDTMNIPNLGVMPPPAKDGRFEGFLGQPNAYGQFLVLYLPACLAVYLTERSKAGRILAALGILATLLALLLTASRGAYAGLLAGAILGAFYLRRYISTQTVVRATVSAMVLCAVVITVTIAAGYSDLYIDRFDRMEGTAHVATSGRTSIWSNALASMMENPLSFISGYGFYSYDSDRSFRLATHNVYLSYLYNLGIIGLSLFLLMFARVLAAARTAVADSSGELRSQFVALVFGLLSFLVAIFFSDYQEAGYLLWAYVGITMRAAMNLGGVDAAHLEAAEESQLTTRPGPAVAGSTSPAWSRRDARQH